MNSKTFLAVFLFISASIRFWRYVVNYAKIIIILSMHFIFLLKKRLGIDRLR